MNPNSSIQSISFDISNGFGDLANILSEIKKHKIPKVSIKLNKLCFVSGLKFMNDKKSTLKIEQDNLTHTEVFTHKYTDDLDKLIQIRQEIIEV